MNRFPFSELIVAFITGFSMWFWNSRKTKRENKQIDFENLNASFNTMIESQKKLMEQNEQLIEKLLVKEQENAQLRIEIECLKKTVRSLECKINHLLEKNKT
jgi:sensor histidine kinase YesM